MILYYAKLAFRSLRGTPVQTAITVLAIALGIAVPTVMFSIHHVFAQNPIPEKSDVLYNVRVDSWDADTEFFDVRPGDPPKHITYRDMEGLRRSEIPRYSTGISMANTFVFPPAEDLSPYQTRLRLCHADFFPMFEVPFRYGGPWDNSADRDRKQVVVLSQEGNETLFGGENSVGRTVRFGPAEYTVVGVLASFNPSPLFYDVINNQMGPTLDFFVPFDLIREPSLALSRTGDSDNWGGPVDSEDPDAQFTASERTWIQYWVELAPDQVEPYQSFVDSYAMTQKELGRFPRPLNNHVTPLMEWMAIREVVPPVSVALLWISLLFLVVCALNLIGLLLSRFLARAPQLGVHRALGASRASIFVQRLLECEMVGILGGLAGLGLAGIALVVLDHSLPDRFVPPGTFQLDGYSLGVALALSLLAGFLSGLYPAWRACRIAPAHQLKLQ